MKLGISLNLDLLPKPSMSSGKMVMLMLSSKDNCEPCDDVLSWSVMSNTLQRHGLWPTRLLCPWGFSKQEY